MVGISTYTIVINIIIIICIAGFAKIMIDAVHYAKKRGQSVVSALILPVICFILVFSYILFIVFAR